MPRTEAYCPWCDELNDLEDPPNYCCVCGHRTDLPRSDCDCPDCLRFRAVRHDPLTMPIRDALDALWAALSEASDTQVRAVIDILNLGARIPPLPPGAAMAHPTDLPADSWSAYEALKEVILGQQEPWQDFWEPVYTGHWKDVLATLVIARDWDRISFTAQCLREAAARRSTGEADR
jgi:hypothetical protein